MIGTHKKKTLNLILVFALIFSLFTPFSANVSKAAEIISVADAIANNSGSATVEGYIVGYAKSGSSYKHEGPFLDTEKTNLGIADTVDEKDPSKIMPVQLTDGFIRTNLNLFDHPENLGKKVQISGTLTAYFGVPGLKSPTGYTFVENTDPTKVQAVTATPNAGSVAEDTLVELSTGTEGATIRYTTDGNEPTTSSQEYSEPIQISTETTIKAFAVKDGLDNSEVSTFTYTILTENTIAEVRNLEIGSNVMTTGVVTAVIGATTFIQDEAAGIVLYGFDLNVEPGDQSTCIRGISRVPLSFRDKCRTEKRNSIGKNRYSRSRSTNSCTTSRR